METRDDTPDPTLDPILKKAGEILRGTVPTHDKNGVDMRVGRRVRFYNGQTGVVLLVCDEERVTGRGRMKPSFRVLTDQGQMTWWYQERTRFIP